MASQFPSSLFLPFQESNNALPQYVRLFRAFQQAIVNGDLDCGAKLPATRALCAELGISRNTVKTAYEMLHAEGYVETRHGAGSFVATNLPLDTVGQKEDQSQQQAQIAPKMSEMAQVTCDGSHAKPHAERGVIASCTALH